MLPDPALLHKEIQNACDNIRRWMQHYMDLHDISLREFAKRVRASPAGISLFLSHPERGISVRTVVALSYLLGRGNRPFPIETLFYGYVPPASRTEPRDR